MKLAVVCCTYGRPRLLPQVIGAFLRQDYPAERREMIVLDDAGQYEEQSGEGWTLVSVARRFRTLGEKRNACAALASDDVDAYVVWDDDDLYLPHALSAHAEALDRAPWSLPGRVLVENRAGQVECRPTRGLYHSGWAYKRECFARVGGYPFMQSGQDQALAARFRKSGVATADPTKSRSPQLVYRWATTRTWHLSALPRARGYEMLAARGHCGGRMHGIRPYWPQEYDYLCAGEASPRVDQDRLRKPREE